MFNSIFDGINLTFMNVAICMGVSILLGIITALIYMKTSRYSKNFVVTLAILPLLVFAVMVMVNGNLGTSVAVLGAFSLVRFRSLPGTSKEILTIFLSMAIGLSVGMGQIGFAFFMTIVANLSLLLLYFVRFGEKRKKIHQLKILVPENLDYTSIFDDALNKWTSKYQLLGVKTVNMGSMFELTYEVVLKDNAIKPFIDDLRVRNGNMKIQLTRELNDQYEL